MIRKVCYAAVLIAATLSLAACSFNQPAKGTTTVNVAAVLYPGGGGPPAALALYKAALEVSKLANGEYDLKLVTISPTTETMKGNQRQQEPPTVSALEQALYQDPPPDVVLFSSAHEFNASVAKELLLDIDQYVRGDKAMPKDDYFTGAVEAVSDGGRLFGLPVSGSPTMLRYDKRLFDAAGLQTPSSPWSWSEFLDVARSLTKVSGDGNDQYALSMLASTNILPALVWQNGGEVVSRDGRRTLLSEPPALDAIRFLYDLTFSYKVAAPPFKGGQGMVAKPAIAVRVEPGQAPPLFSPGGRVAMTFEPGGVWLGQGSLMQGEDRPLRLAEVPRGKVQATMLDLQNVVALTSKARNPRLAYKVAATLVAEMQKESAQIPMRRSAARNLRQMNPGLGEDDTQVMVHSLAYARPMPLNGSEKFMRPFYEKLISPLQSGTKKPDEIVKDAVEALDQALNE